MGKNVLPLLCVVLLNGCSGASDSSADTSGAGRPPTSGLGGNSNIGAAGMSGAADPGSAGRAPGSGFGGNPAIGAGTSGTVDPGSAGRTPGSGFGGNPAGGARSSGGASIGSPSGGTRSSGGASIGSPSGGARSSGGASIGSPSGGAPTIGGAPPVGGTAATAGTSLGQAGTVAVAPKSLWSMGYYANWQATQYPVSAIEWSGMTHVAMAFYMPDAKGNLTLTGGDAALARSLVTTAHAHGVKAIASLGGAESAAAFRAATAASAVGEFVKSIVALLDDPGYDGIDVDWEPLEHSDELVAIDLANRIRAAKSSALLTIPVMYLNANLSADLGQYSAIAAAYDQVNVMTYGMAGAWQGWKSWHSSALYHQDSATPTSIDSSVKLYLNAGVPKNKLGIGIGFYGLCYSPPVTAPAQSLNAATLIAGDGAISYARIMSNYYSAAAYHWDAVANVPYLSFASAQPPDGCGYVSYDDEQSIAAKANYVKSLGLGGVIQWEINEGYLADAAAGQKNPLLTAIASSFLQ